MPIKIRRDIAHSRLLCRIAKRSAQSIRNEGINLRENGTDIMICLNNASIASCSDGKSKIETYQIMNT